MTYVPPGFVLKHVHPTSAEGTVAFSPSVTRLGILKDAEFEFEGSKLTKWRSRGSFEMLSELVGAVPPEKRTLAFITVGINPLMKHEFGQDRMVSGAIGLGGFGFSGIVRSGSLTVAGREIVRKGRLVLSS